MAANAQTTSSFLAELCSVIGVEHPQPAVEDEKRNTYVFERRVTARHHDGHSTPNFIDLYKRGCFVLEAKQSAKRMQQLAELRQLQLDIEKPRSGSSKREGIQWDTMMMHAREQAEAYARRLPISEGWPPFLIVVDVGHVIELYADFSLQGKHYAQFPDRQSYRIALADLHRPEVRERLRRVWSEPMQLNPANHAAAVTTVVAELLARLSRSMESRMLRDLPDPAQSTAEAQFRHMVAEKVALFLMRCLFTMFAERVGLLVEPTHKAPQRPRATGEAMPAPRRGSFAGMLREYVGQADKLHFALTKLWSDMDNGSFSTELRVSLLHFNGGLFKDATALPVTEDDLALLLIAAERDWKDVEPAIFGTLLERALAPSERHKLGAHYTPRAFVEHLVSATIIDALADDWRNVRTAAAQFAEKGEVTRARSTVRDFHGRLCELRILDPACGTGNFLYVALELLKRLEGEVLDALAGLGDAQGELLQTIGPHQFLGLEVNPRAVAIAELVLWIGYLQWHFRTRGNALPAEPVLGNFHTIKEQDAIVAYERWDVLRDAEGRPLSRWDGVTHRLHPVTGELIPDPEARIELRRYIDARAAEWPTADFIVGNPPFTGGKDMREEFGGGYAEAAWAARPDVPGGADFVMHFWDKAAETVRTGGARRFGLITTNSIVQKFARRVVGKHLSDSKHPLSLIMAIPDHPWVKASDKAAVRIAMTVGQAGIHAGVLRTVVSETDLDTDAPRVELTEVKGRINADLSVGANVAEAAPLGANDGLCSRGVALHGDGFIVTPAQAQALGLGKIDGLDEYIRPYLNGRDLAGRRRGVMVIDLYPLDSEAVRARFPAVYQWVFDRVKPERDENREPSRKKYWWWFGRTHEAYRAFTRGLRRYIVTPETSSHRWFTFLDGRTRADNMLVTIGLDDAFFLGVLSSRIHTTWAIAAGGWLGVGNDPRYSKTRCFDPFPFPEPSEQQRKGIAALAEQLDAHRVTVLANHNLTMTGMYNVLNKVRQGEKLSEGERTTYEDGLVGVLGNLHQQIDDAVASAYGWPTESPDDEILARLVALNQERSKQELDGVVRWLRPAFQAPEHAPQGKPRQLEVALEPAAGARAAKPALPASLPDQVAAVRAILAATGRHMDAAQVSGKFSNARRNEPRVEELLRTLALLGQAELGKDGYRLLQ